MRHPFLFIAYTGLLLTTHAQDADTRQKRWTLGAGIALDGGYRSLVLMEDNAFTRLLVESRDANEVFRITFSAGIDAVYTLNERWSLATGLRYSDRGFRIRQLRIVDINGNQLGQARASFHYTYLSIPIMVRMRTGNGPVRFEPALGIHADRFLDQYTTSTGLGYDGQIYGGTGSDPMNKYTTLGLSAAAELGLTQDLTERTVFRAAVHVRHQLYRIVEAPISARLYEVGLLFQLGIRL